jgi:hypothetical protein
MKPCESCGKSRLGLLVITEEITHFYCRGCIKKGLRLLETLPFKNGEVRDLIKKFRRYLRKKTN